MTADNPEDLVTDAESRPTPTDSAQVGEAPDLGRLVNPAPAGTVVGPKIGGAAGAAGGVGAVGGAGAAGSGASVPGWQAGAVRPQDAAQGAGQVADGQGSAGAQSPVATPGTMNLQGSASEQGAVSSQAPVSGQIAAGGQGAPQEPGTAPEPQQPASAQPPQQAQPSQPDNPFAPPQDTPPPPPVWGAPPTPPPGWGEPPRQPYGQVRPGPVQPWGSERPREPERPVPQPWHDPNRYGPVQPGQDQRRDDPDRRYRDQREEQRQPQRRERDMPTRWALGLSLGATVCTLLALYQGPATFPAWMVGAGAGFALAVAAFVFAIRAQRVAAQKQQRASEATASLVSACVSGMLSALLLVASIVWFGPFTDYAKCMQGANTQAAQTLCLKAFEQRTGMVTQ